jgi:hypothetical protein
MSTDTAQPSHLIAPSLFAFGIFYGGMVCIAGVLGNKQVALGPLAVEAGIFAFCCWSLLPAPLPSSMDERSPTSW